jgi:ABC-type Fe3+ transport system substrate-binding protein
MFEKKNAAKVKTVVDYALSAEGQKIVEVGYIPLINKRMLYKRKGCSIRATFL